MKITQEIREFAAKEGLAEEEAIEAGLEEKAREFKEKGSEIYVPS
jgi:phosphomethylpyrimidine synthase